MYHGPFGVTGEPTMRLGIFSDVHANLEAMSSVMEAYGSEDIDTY